MSSTVAESANRFRGARADWVQTRVGVPTEPGCNDEVKAGSDYPSTCNMGQY